MHSGEIPLEAAMRECFEESGRMATFPSSPTGIAGAPDGFVGYQEHRAEPSGLLTLNFNFVADLPDRTIIPCAEYRNFRWFTPDAIASFEGEMPTHVAQVALMAMHFPERALPPRQRR